MEQEEQIKALNNRIEENKSKPKINNASLPAGSPMYFYCRMCNEETDVLPEDYTTPPNKHCFACQQMINDGWSESDQSFVKYEIVPCEGCGGNGLGIYDYYLKRRRKCSTCFGHGSFERKVS